MLQYLLTGNIASVQLITLARSHRELLCFVNCGKFSHLSNTVIPRHRYVLNSLSETETQNGFSHVVSL